MSFTLELDQKPTHWRLGVAGDLDYGTCSQFRMSIDRILMSDLRCTVVDLSALTFLDSSALGLLLAMSKEYASLGGRLVLITNENVQRVLSIVKLDDHFATTSTMECAIRVLGCDVPALEPSGWA